MVSPSSKRIRTKSSSDSNSRNRNPTEEEEESGESSSTSSQQPSNTPPTQTTTTTTTTRTSPRILQLQREREAQIASERERGSTSHRFRVIRSLPNRNGNQNRPPNPYRALRSPSSPPPAYTTNTGCSTSTSVPIPQTPRTSTRANRRVPTRTRTRRGTSSSIPDGDSQELESQNLPNPEDPRRNGGQRIRTPLEEIPLWWADERGDEIRRNAEGSGFEPTSDPGPSNVPPSTNLRSSTRGALTHGGHRSARHRRGHGLHLEVPTGSTTSSSPTSIPQTPSRRGNVGTDDFLASESPSTGREGGLSVPRRGRRSLPMNVARGEGRRESAAAASTSRNVLQGRNATGNGNRETRSLATSLLSSGIGSSSTGRGRGRGGLRSGNSSIESTPGEIQEASNRLNASSSSSSQPLNSTPSMSTRSHTDHSNRSRNRNPETPSVNESLEDSQTPSLVRDEELSFNDSNSSFLLASPSRNSTRSNTNPNTNTERSDLPRLRRNRNSVTIDSPNQGSSPSNQPSPRNRRRIFSEPRVGSQIQGERFLRSRPSQLQIRAGEVDERTNEGDALSMLTNQDQVAEGRKITRTEGEEGEEGEEGLVQEAG